MSIDPPEAEWNRLGLRPSGLGLRPSGLGLRPSGLGLRPSGYDPTRRPHKSLDHFEIDRIHYSMFDVGRSMFDVHYF